MMRSDEEPLRLADVWAFCHARLNEDATALLAYRDGHQGPCINHSGQAPAVYDETQPCILHREAAEAAPYRDAEFGLADVAFKRMMLEEHEPDLQAAVQGEEMTPMVVCRIDGDDCPFTQRLAVLYARHPDFQESWRP